VYGVGIVPQQRALRTSEAYLVGDENRARQPEKQRHPEDHDDDGDQPAQRARQRYVAEPGGGQRGDGKIKRVDVVVDPRIVGMLGFVDEAGRNEQEHGEIRTRDDDVLMPPEGVEVGAQPREELIAAQQPQRRDDERQRSQVQYQKAVAEPVGFWRVAFIEIPQPVLEAFDATQTCNEFPTPHVSPKAQGSGIVAAWPSIPEGGQCPLWVRSRHVRCTSACLLWATSGHVRF
jgi:hypothetical protein